MYKSQGCERYLAQGHGNSDDGSNHAAANRSGHPRGFWDRRGSRRRYPCAAHSTCKVLQSRHQRSPPLDTIHCRLRLYVQRQVVAADAWALQLYLQAVSRDTLKEETKEHSVIAFLDKVLHRQWPVWHIGNPSCMFVHICTIPLHQGFMIKELDTGTEYFQTFALDRTT